MGREIRTTCDCCEREIVPDEYYIKLQPYYIWQGSGNFRKEYQENDNFTWYICERCLKEIGRQVSENTTVNVDIDVLERSDS